MKRIAIWAGALALAITWAGSAFAQSTLAAVKAKGYVQCGVNTGLAGFSQPDSKGVWHGLDVDMCRAVAAAVFGDASKVHYTPLTAQQRFTALQSGEIDMLSRNTTWTITRDTNLGLTFAGVDYYDGQGCMVAKKLEEVTNAFFSGRCDVFTTDVSGLVSTRGSRAPNPADYVILPEVISKEPLGPVVRRGDENWFDIVKWSLFAMLNAEELGLSSKNIDQQLSSTNPAIQRFVGTSGDIGKMMGLDNRWAYNIVKQVGNYGESFDANLTPLGFERGLNRLWTHGGIMYAPPIR
jgi:general L-amino acid transport system substrate-binding protein